MKKTLLFILTTLPCFYFSQLVTINVNDTINFTGQPGDYDSYKINMGSGLIYDDYILASIGGANGAQHGVKLSTQDGGAPMYLSNRNKVILGSNNNELHQYNVGDYVQEPFPHGSESGGVNKYILKDGQSTNFQLNSTYYIGLARVDTSTSFPNYKYFFGYVKVKTLSDNFTLIIDKIVYQETVDTPVKIEEITLIEEKNEDFIVYPNPTKDYLNIESTKEFKAIQIVNINGSIIKEYKTTKINLNELKRGFYTLRLIDKNNEIYHEQIIKN